MPAELFFSKPENLNRALSEAGLDRVSVAVKHYNTQVSLTGFIAERSLGGLGRFMRHELDSRTWKQFQNEVTDALRASHPDPVIIQDTVLLATGYKS